MFIWKYIFGSFYNTGATPTKPYVCMNEFVSVFFYIKVLAIGL